MIKTDRISHIMLAVIAGISVIFIGFLIFNIGCGPGNAGIVFWININLRWMYIVLVLSVILLIFFAVHQIVTWFESAKSGLLGIVAFTFIFFISYLFSSKEYPKFPGVEKFIADGTITPAILKIVDTTLYSTYIIFGLAVIFLVYSLVSRHFK